MANLEFSESRRGYKGTEVVYKETEAPLLGRLRRKSTEAQKREEVSNFAERREGAQDGLKARTLIIDINTRFIFKGDFQQ